MNPQEVEELIAAEDAAEAALEHIERALDCDDNTAHVHAHTARELLAEAARTLEHE